MSDTPVPDSESVEPDGTDGTDDTLDEDLTIVTELLADYGDVITTILDRLDALEGDAVAQATASVPVLEEL